MRGIIASDIDRTLTDRDHKIPKNVVEYFKERHLEGFEIVFLTGRTLSFCKKALELCDFPYHLGVTNGAEVLKMPGEHLCMQKFFDKEIAKKVCKASTFTDRSFVFYSGFEAGDVCFYVSSDFSGYGKEYIEKMISYKSTKYEAISSLEELQRDKFPIMRTFGTLQEMEELQQRVEAVNDGSIDLVILHDVTTLDGYLLYLAAKNINKGSCLRRLIDHNGWKGCVIACGDDLNDVSMFAEADITIAMENGHPKLIENATIIAKPSYEMGVIEALNQAIGMIHD